MHLILKLWSSNRQIDYMEKFSHNYKCNIKYNEISIGNKLFTVYL